MSEQVPEPEVTPAPPEPEVTPVPTFQISEKEWRETQDAVQRIATYLQPQQEEYQPDPENPMEQMAYYVDQRLAQIDPYVRSAAKNAGEANMNKMFDDIAKSESLDFDRELASRLSESYFNNTGDPVASVQEGARMAAQIRANERDQGIKTYQSKLKKSPSDLPAESAGERLAPDANTYDEVVAKWSASTEV